MARGTPGQDDRLECVQENDQDAEDAGNESEGLQLNRCTSSGGVGLRGKPS